jgi:ribonuclease/clavin/mitogillin
MIIVKEGDTLTTWLGKDVKIIEVPGHDEGQLAIMPEAKEWFLAGDLFQGVGTVVVGGVEGNMTKYFHTLEKVIALKPKCVVPSHGIALGGTNILEKTLEHRKFREDQIMEMYISGLSLDQMLSQIYFDLPEKIIKYARANIESHIDKLKMENKI